MPIPSFQAVFDASPDASVVLDVAGAIVAANPACLALLGVDERVTGQPQHALFPGASVEVSSRLVTSWKRVVQSHVADVVAGVPYQVSGRSPPDRVCRVASSPIEEGGVVVGVLQQIVDVTTPVRSPVQHEEHEQLVSMVSHDLRNALNAIVLSTSVLGRDGADARQSSSVTRILSSTGRATQLIRDLLDFTHSRVTGDLAVKRAPADVPALISTAVDDVQAWFPTRVLTREHKGETSALLDAERIGQVVTTLLTQALRRHPRDGVTVRSQVDEEGVVVDVHDAGVISPAELALIFEPLQRTTNSGAGRSAGLGLYIASKIAQAHHGMLMVRSVVGEGTHCTLRLPR
ncbi:MAG: PAS domain-containing sensor histidine kinase [Deltaproteobacteria bacterium]|nr:PAS domain-containing sensor histidine kinase [Deltaproteobacteria bacterium]